MILTDGISTISYTFADAQRPRTWEEQAALWEHPVFRDLEPCEFVPCLHLPPECWG